MRELLYCHLRGNKDKYKIRAEPGPTPTFSRKLCPKNCPECNHYLSMSDELVDEMKDAHKTFKAKFEN
eukprot:1614996-Karenia_brevis.AAC.1